MANNLPESGFLRVKQIIGDRKANPPIIAIIPVSKTTWWDGVKSGRFPKPTHALGPGITAWNVVDIRRFIEQAAPSAEAA